METKFYVYIHVRPDGTPFYVGKGCGDRHLPKWKRNAHHSAIVNKHGAGNVTVSMFPAESESAAYELEIAWILALRLSGFTLSNMTDGGDGTSNMSSEIKQKISRTKTGGKASPETRVKMSAAQQGKKRGPMSDALKAKLSAIRMGKKPSPEAIAKSAASRTGAKRSDATRAALSATKKAHWATAEYRSKIVATNTGRVMTVEQNAKNAEKKRAHWNDAEYRAKQSAAHAGRKWANNGNVSIQVYPTDPLPEGFAYGRAKKGGA